MIISRTPFRISFFGGGTDYPAWYLSEGGAVLSTTIDKYCFISVRYLPPFFNIRHRVVWSHIETVWQIREILHPAVREGLRFLKFDDTTGFEIHHQGDVPARSGVGSSSAFVVGLINALSALRGEILSKPTLAQKAIELEQTVLRENVGCQDQIAIANGGFNAIRFLPGGDHRIEPVAVTPSRIAELEAYLMLVFTGTSRLSSEIAGELVESFDANRLALRRMKAMVDEALATVRGSGALEPLGHLLHEAWMLKRGLGSSVSSEQIDALYDTARRHGALGGKLLGAGGAGFMVLFVPPERRGAVQRALDRYLQVPFRFETEGSVLIYPAATGPAPAAVR